MNREADLAHPVGTNRDAQPDRALGDSGPTSGGAKTSQKLRIVDAWPASGAAFRRRGSGKERLVECGEAHGENTEVSTGLPAQRGSGGHS